MKELKAKRKNKILIVLVILIILATLGVLSFFYFKKLHKESRQAEATQRAKEEQQVKLEKNSRQSKTEIIKPKPEKIEEQTRSWQIYENKLYRYKIKFPKNWYSASTNTEDAWIAYFTNYDPKDISENESPPGVRVEVLVQGNPRGLSLKNWVEEGHLFSGKPLSSEKIQVAGLPAIKEEVDFEGLRQTVYFFRGNDVVTISYTGKTPDYEKNKEIFDMMIKSFEIKK